MVSKRFKSFLKVLLWIFWRSVRHGTVPCVGQFGSKGDGLWQLGYIMVLTLRLEVD